MASPKCIYMAFLLLVLLALGASVGLCSDHAKQPLKSKLEKDNNKPEEADSNGVTRRVWSWPWSNNGHGDPHVPHANPISDSSIGGINKIGRNHYPGQDGGYPNPYGPPSPTPPPVQPCSKCICDNCHPPSLPRCSICDCNCGCRSGHVECGNCGCGCDSCDANDCCQREGYGCMTCSFNGCSRQETCGCSPPRCRTTCACSGGCDGGGQGCGDYWDGCSNNNGVCCSCSPQRCCTPMNCNQDCCPRESYPMGHDHQASDHIEKPQKNEKHKQGYVVGENAHGEEKMVKAMAPESPSAK